MQSRRSAIRAALVVAALACGIPGAAWTQQFFLPDFERVTACDTLVPVHRPGLVLFCSNGAGSVTGVVGKRLPDAPPFVPDQISPRVGRIPMPPGTQLPGNLVQIEVNERGDQCAPGEASQCFLDVIPMSGRNFTLMAVNDQGPLNTQLEEDPLFAQLRCGCTTLVN